MYIILMKYSFDNSILRYEYRVSPHMIVLPGTWSHLWFAGVRECPSWCSIGATVTIRQFFCILHSDGEET